MRKTSVVVTVIAERDARGIQWDFDCSAHPPGKAKKEIDKLIIDGPEDADITFDLADSTGLHLRFEEAGRDAIWIGPAVGCPTGPGDGDGAFRIPNKAGGKKLTVENIFASGSSFQYRLRFTSSAGPQDYDPIIINR